MNRPTNAEIANKEVIDLRGILNKALFHWPLYVLLFLISLFCAYLYLRYTKPVFSTTAKIYIKDEKSNGRNSTALGDIALFQNGKVVDNEMEVISSPLILESVIKDNKFNVRYYIKGKVANKELYETVPVELSILSDSAQVGNYDLEVVLLNNRRIKVEYGTKENIHSITTNFNRPFKVGKDTFSLIYNQHFNPNEDKDFVVSIDSILPLVYKKSGEIQSVRASRVGSVVELTYEDEIPKRAADFLNAVLYTYNSYTLNDKNQITLNTIKFIESRLDSLGRELNGLERNVEVFKKTRGITELEESSRLILDQAKEGDQKLNDAQIQLSVYDQIDKYINTPGNSASFTPVLGTVDPSLTNLVNRYEDALREKAKLSLAVREGNPLMDEVETQITNSRKTIKDYIAGFRRNATTQRNGLQGKVNEIEGKINQIPTYEREFINIKRQQSVKEGLYNYLLQKKEEATVSFASNIVDNKVISPAYIPTSPIKPKRLMVYIGFIFAGIIAASAYLVLKYFSNSKITSKADIQTISEIPVIGEIYKQDEQKDRKVNLNDRSVLTEQVLNLRNNLKFLLAGVTDTPVILFTSSISGEGKTFISSYLAKSLTSNNKRVILMELDLRKPKLSQTLDIDNKKGITNYLVGAEKLEDIIKPVPQNPGLYIIPSGTIPPNPVELLESEKMKELFNILKGRFDYIIIDTCPVGMVSDAKSLAPFTNCSLIVTRFNYTPSIKFKEMITDIDKSIFQKPAIVFNGVDLKSSYGYYSYGYSNYGYGYGNEKAQQQTGLKMFWRTLWQRVF